MSSGCQSCGGQFEVQKRRRVWRERGASHLIQMIVKWNGMNIGGRLEERHRCFVLFPLQTTFGEYPQ